MNTVIFNCKKASMPLEKGDFFTSHTQDDVYILGYFEDRYVVINLADGNRWREPSASATDAAKGLIPLGRNKTISIC